MKKKMYILLSIISLCIAVFLVLGAGVIHKKNQAKKEKVFVILRNDCFYNSAKEGYERRVVQFYFVSTEKKSPIFDIENVAKGEIRCGEDAFYCEIKKEKNYDVFKLDTKKGDTYYLKPVDIGIDPEISSSQYKNCQMHLTYTNGKYVDFNIGNISSLHDECEYDNNEMDITLLTSYGKDEDLYNTYGVCVGIHTKEDITIKGYDTTAVDYEPSLEKTIVLEQKVDNFDAENVIEKYPGAEFKNSSENNKKIVLKKNHDYILIIPFKSNFDIPLGYYAQTIKYTNSSEMTKEKCLDFEQVYTIVGINEDIVENMRGKSNGTNVVTP